MSFKRYGYEWDEGTTNASVELHCYRHLCERWDDKAFHLSNAIKINCPEELPNGRRGYVWHKWTDTRIESFVRNNYSVWWGPSSTAKSTDAAVIAINHWLAEMRGTTVTVCSTSAKMLRRRIWREFLRFFAILKDRIPARFFRSQLAILYDDGSGDYADTNSGIFGVAVQEGTVEDAVGKIVGAHNDYNVLIIDEMQATRPAAEQAWDNISTGLEAKFLGMGNPVSRLDTLGQASEPDAGWESVSTQLDRWKTVKGMCYFFDGRKSPGVEDPEKFPFLLTQKQLDDMKKFENTPRYWSQRIGFVAPQGMIETVMNELYASKYHVLTAPTWKRSFVRGAGLDPSWATGGDLCVLVTYMIGYFTDGTYGIAFDPPHVIPKLIGEDELMTYKIYEQVRAILEELKMKPRDLGIDCSATQSALADVFEREWERGIHRVQFGGSPSEMPVSAEDARLASDVYKNRVSELWYTASNLAQGDQIRGLPPKAFTQFCARTLDPRGGRQILVESKKDMKARIGVSPDDADAVVTCIDHARTIHGLMPMGGPVDRATLESEDEFYRDMDVDGHNDTYLTPPNFS